MANEFKIKHGFVSTGDGTVEGEIRVSGIAYAENGSRLATRAYLSQFLTDNNYVVTGDLPTNISAFTNDSGYLTEIIAHTHSAADITSGTLSNDRLSWNATDNFSGTYSLLWNASNALYTASWLQVRGSDDTLLTRNIVADGTVTGTNLMVSNWNAAHAWGDHDGLYDTAGTGAAEAGTVNTRIDDEIIPLIDTKQPVGDYLTSLPSHNHDDRYVKLSGSTMGGDVTWTSTGRGLQWTMNTDGAYIRFYNTGDSDTNSRLEYGTTDNGNEYHRFMVAGVERMAITAGGISATGYNKSQWDSAYAWGNHASVGYLTTVPSEYLTQTEGDARYDGIGAAQEVHDRIDTEVLPSIPTNNNELTNGAGYITDGNTGWNNSYGFITASSTDTLTNKSGNISQWTNDSGYITDGNTGWNNTYGFITGLNWTDLGGDPADINVSQFTNDAGYITDGNQGWNNTYGFITASASITGNAATATKLATARNIALSGAVTGNANFDGSGNITIATTATSDPTLTLAGDASGSATFTNLGNATLTVTVANDSHTHDGRYYTESESDARFVNVTGDNLTGDLSVSGASLSVTSTADGSEAFFVDGVNGRLFTITDSLSDSLFSVNTISGLPVIEAFSDNTVKLGPFSNPVTIDGAGVLAIGGETAATQSYVTTAINNLVGGAPGALNTLNELAAAINDDASFASSVTSSLALKAPLASPALTGTPTAPTQSTSNNSTRIATTAFVKAQGYVTTDTNYYLNGISKSGNTLTFSVNGATNQTYTFGSNAFTSYSNHVGLYDSVGTAASEAGEVNTRIDEEVLPLIQTPAITSNGSTPALNTGISAAEIRSLIGAGTSSSDNNYYLSGASFNTGNGVLALTVAGADNQTVDLDGRYAYSSHNHTSLNLTGSIYNGNANYSIDLRDHSDRTWLRNAVGGWTFQAGTSGDDWTQSYTFYLPAAGTTANAVWAEIGQRDSNDSAAGRYRGLRIVKDTGGVADGDLRAGAIYIGTTRRDDDWTAAFNWGNHAGLYDGIGSADEVNQRIDNEVLPAIPTVPTNVSAFTNDAGYITDGNTNWNNSYGFITASSNITGNAATATTATNLGTYYTADTWFRATSDNNTVKFYGNSRMMVFRTDGEGGDTGHTGYAFKWTYGGDATGNSLMLLDNNGNLWTKSYGWLHSRFETAGAAGTVETNVNTRIDEEVLPLIQTPAITSDGSTPSLNTGISAAEVRSLIGAQASGSYLTTSGKAADSNLLDGQDSTSFFRALPGIAGADKDALTGNGFLSASYSGYSSQLWTVNSGGSTGTVQMEFEYNTPSRGFKIRNKTDNNTWSSTGYVVMTTNNQGHISGNLWHTGNFNPANYQPAGTYNTVIGTDSDINTSGATIIDNIYVTDGVITSMGTRTLTQADLGIPTNTSGNWWNGGYAAVGTDGVMEVGKYIDFHDTDTQTSDFSYRITNTGGRLYFSGDIEVDGGDLYLNDGNTRLHEAGGNALKVSTNSGYIELGPMNTGHCHIQTDRSNFYFNKQIQVDTGKVSSYNEDLYLQRAGSTKITLGSSVTTFANYITVPQPAPPTFNAANIVGETIEVVFEQSGTSGVDAYQVWSSTNDGAYGLIANIPTQDIAATMTAIDAVFSVSGDQAYRVYAIKNGIYSDPAEGSVAYTASGLDVLNMSVVNLNTAYYIQYDMPASRFVDHIEIYMDAEASSGSLSRTGATLVYSGNNTNYMYQIASADMNKFHQFWVEVIES